MSNKSKQEVKKSGRFCLKQDDDSHWYLIPVKDVKKFDKLVEHGEDDDWNDFNKAFSEMRCNGPHTMTFTDPQEDL